MMVWYKSFVFLLGCSLSVYLADYLKPVPLIGVNDVNIEKFVPVAIGGWSVDESSPMVVTDPGLSDLLDRTYSQVLNRTYVNKGTNNIVMLSIAYGTTQNKENQVHFPDVCYPAQGFEISELSDSYLYLETASIPVKRMRAKKGGRVEDVTYWVRLGGSIVNNRFEQKINTLKYGLQGAVRDGLIFRVSTVNQTEGFEVQGRFLREFMSSLSNKERDFFITANPNGA